MSEVQTPEIKENRLRSVKFLYFRIDVFTILLHKRNLFYFGGNGGWEDLE